MTKRTRHPGISAASGAFTIAALASAEPAAVAAAATEMPLVRVSEDNAPPACATPGRLMAYLYARNPSLDTRFSGIASEYVRLGRELGVRWDYAFFQMIVETGSLGFRRDDNRQGTVKPDQNNFAGLGAAGAGQPGEAFSDVSTGVKAHLQHLLMYSGERVESPVAERTRKVQQWGVLTPWHKSLRHPIGFTDVARRWATDPGYATNISAVAHRFFDGYCVKEQPASPVASAPLVSHRLADRGSGEARISGLDLARAAIERARQDGDDTRQGLGLAPDTIPPTRPLSPNLPRTAITSAPPAAEQATTMEPAVAVAPAPVRTASLTPPTPGRTAPATAAPASPVALPAPPAKPANAADEAVRLLVSGKTFILDAAMGLTIPIVVHVNGTLRGTASGVAASFLGAASDEGRWWISHGRLCQRWNVWLDREMQCLKLRQAGGIVHWVRDDGKTGTARIASR